MKYSVLIAAYNVENYIGECINSFLNQDFTDYEIVIIDDGSKDKTGEICDLYAQNFSHIRVFHWDNHGLILSRRKAIELAKGEYLLFVDADDSHVNDSLSSLDRILLKTKADVIVFRFNFLYEDLSIKESKVFVEKKYEKNDTEELFYDFVENYEYNHLWCKLIKRSVIACDPTDYIEFKNIKMGEDLLQSIFVFYNSNKTVISNKILYNYRVLNNSMSHLFDKKQVIDIDAVYTALLSFVKSYFPNNSKLVEEIKIQFCIRLASLLRALWDSSMNEMDKREISNLIVSTCNNNGIKLYKKSVVIQNRIMLLLSSKGMWRLLKYYSSVLRLGRKLK